MRGLAFLWGGGGLSEQAPRARANSRSRVRLVCLQYCVHFDGLLGSVSFRLPGGGRGLSEPCARTARELVHTHTHTFDRILDFMHPRSIRLPLFHLSCSPSL